MIVADLYELGFGQGHLGRGEEEGGRRHNGAQLEKVGSDKGVCQEAVVGS